MTTGIFTASLLPNDSLMGRNADLGVSGEGAGYDNGKRALFLSGSNKLVDSTDGDTCAASTSGGATVLGTVADCTGLGGLPESKLVTSTDDIDG